MNAGPRPAVLVAWAGRSGSTAEIGGAIATELEAHGFSVTVSPCREVDTVSGYRAVVLGSAIYVRRWEDDAVEFLERFGSELSEMPTWVFQSGPCGAGSQTEQVDVPHRVSRLLHRWRLRGPMTFGGRLDTAHAVSRVGRWMASSESLAGDFRDWDGIRTWAAQVSADLASLDLPTTGPSPELVHAFPTTAEVRGSVS